ncbi:MAG: hypothetical protein KF855_08410 [Acidobacteria bacterium]|nr:hypothetical protein [Acidobacteriota bacterium]
MWEKLFQGLKDLVFVLELSRRNSEEIKELKKRNDEIMLYVERLAFEIQRVRENEAHERDKILLKLDLDPKPKKKLSPKKRTK